MRAPWRAWLGVCTQAALLAGTTGVAAWGLMQAPFVAPLVARGTEDARRIIEARFADALDAGWLEREITAALERGDTARALALADLAQAEGRSLPPPLADRVAAARDGAEAWHTIARDCAACAWDMRACASPGLLAACALPTELSPLGDVNALRRNAVAALSGQEVDRFETGLALIGMGATAAVLASGGGSAPVKAGATALRAARRLGTLTPEFARVLGDAADLPVNWAAALRMASLEEITDTAKLARLGGIATDLGRVVAQTGPADTLLLLRHVDSAEDAATLARLADATGPRTLSRLEVLGKSRAFRATLRLTDLAVGTLAALWAAVVQLGVMMASLTGRLALRLLLRRLL